MAGPDLKEITSGLRFPEGPVALADGSVLLVEIEARAPDARGAPTAARRPCRSTPAGPTARPSGRTARSTSATTAASTGTRMPNIGLRPTGQADDYSGGRIERVDLATGTIETLYTQCDGHPLKGPNDIVFDAHGGFYFTDLGKTRPREMDRGAVYYAKADGSLIKAVAYPTITPNGCALSPDGKTLYFAETESARLWAMDILGARRGEARAVALRARRPPGGLSRRLSALRQHGGRQRRQHLRRHAAQRRHHRVQPGRQERAKHIPMPDLYTTNICFGGPDLRTAYVTLSGSGKLVAFEWERPGLRLNYQSVASGRSVGRAVLVREGVLAVGSKLGVQVDVGIGDLVVAAAVADDQEQDVGVRPIDEAVRVARSGGEAGAHAGPELLRAGIGLQHHLALQHVDELVLAAVCVTVGGLPARNDAREVHAEVLQPGVVAEPAVVAVLVGRAQRLGIARGVALRHLGRIEGGRGWLHGRATRAAG